MSFPTSLGEQMLKKYQRWKTVKGQCVSADLIVTISSLCLAPVCRGSYFVSSLATRALGLRPLSVLS